MKFSRPKKIPKFRSEAEEQGFWETHSVGDYLDPQKVRGGGGSALDFHERATRTISIRLPRSMIEELKTVASRIDVGYQALMKMWLAEKMSEARAVTKGT